MLDIGALSVGIAAGLLATTSYNGASENRREAEAA